MSLPFWHVISGLLVTLGLGLGAGPYVRWAGKSIPLGLPLTADEKLRRQWDELIAGDEGGKFVGSLERVMFFAAFLIDAPLVVGGWLAFKVASKWNAWTNITVVPKEVKGMDELDLAIGRRRWSSHVLTSFLAGTAYNILAGMVGAAVAHNLWKLAPLFR